ncbi:Eco57I restriction-modification methylase domain-containing protein [Lacibacter sp.]|uniref:Eco57I restriction-modification methylase domain-containing protein n=1 Tax=Lacibacter sp. TaxID=1915409 RepID=UPI002B4AE870|nr:TaqI-like C-terminal specificity domain-containing protein [Lacibacter sp.]HLP36684.1 TaqI-like C-terminal specificity domain-containing protein [Lacibacter sp.]
MNFPTKDSAIQKILQLVERFHEQKESYHRSDYNETLTRRDFIDPFFKALGWDVDNEHGFAESYREVIHEDRVKVGGATKAPDYSFRLSGGKRLFFVEAKKPSVLIKDDITPAYQVRRYGWSAKLPISIITDFEEFAIYDCTKKPNPTDKASNGRLKYLTYANYLNEFDFIWDTFSKERVLKGSFDKFIQSDKHKKGTTTVDHEFLQSLDSWRTFLANNIALRNNIDEDELNFIVQHIIDRIIFLRIAEDRSVENYGNLKDTLKGDDYYQNLLRQFHTADQKYNSGLFDFKKDKISDSIEIDNKVIKTIINDLYYPLSPYEFSVLSVEILGSAYEQFLGKTITLSKTGKALIEEKPEVRKAGGVYYTPEYIVEYIVNNTVGKLTEGKTPKDINKLKIVDPACGSGSFLIGAYQFLLNWHKDYYSNNGKPGKGGKDNPLTPDGSLTTAEKKRILLNNIYGVDLDANAVEVTKLSLLLKCMEGETEASIATQLRLFHERILPTLDDNIKCGNSLIDVDFYNTEFDFGEERKVKPFSWKKAFPDVFKQGGFDCVIGNPPYGALFSGSELSYFKNIYSTAVWRGESYLLFIEKGLELLKPQRALGFIIPDTLLNLEFTQPARQLLLQNSKIQQLIGLPSNVFVGATVDTIILLTDKQEYTSEFHQSNVIIKTFGKKQLITEINNPSKEFVVNTKDWFKEKNFNLQTDELEKLLLAKIESGKKNISDVGILLYGIKAYQVGKGKPKQTEKIRNEKPFTSDTNLGQGWLPFYDGKHISRYQLLWKQNNWLNYGEWLAEPRNPSVFEGEKILIRKITGKTLFATYVAETSYCNTLLFVLKLTDKEFSYKSILAILNSVLIGWYFRKKFQISDDDTFPQIMIRDILQFPIPLIDKKNITELNKLTDQLLELNEAKNQQTLQTKIDQLQSRIDFCEQRINEIVYELYNLTKEEIELVEKSAQ